MFQILQRREDPSVRIGQQLGGILQAGIQGYQSGVESAALAKERQAFKEQFGMDLSRDPAIAKVQMAEALKGKREQDRFKSFMDYVNRKKSKPTSNLETRESDEQDTLGTPTEDIQTGDDIDPMEKYILGLIDPMFGQFAAKDEAEARADIRAAKKLKQQDEQFRQSEKSRKVDTLRKETMDIRKDYANKGKFAREGIQNKQNMLELIRSKKLDDPTVAAALSLIPGNFGMRFLSPETVQYKAALIDEFKDLRNIFQGQTRVKELDLLEEKVADIYLTDAQKEAVISSRMNALKSDIIKSEVAAELERELDEKGDFLGLAQFEEEVEKRAKPKLDALFDRILDEQKAVIQDAENRKKTPLDMNDPEDWEIFRQLFHEAGKDKQKARELGKQKGYTW